jgi:ABC-type sugar transport system substrate-binding protein
MSSHMTSASSRWLTGGLAALAAAGIAVAAWSPTAGAAPKTASTKFVIGSVINDLTNPFLAVLGQAEVAQGAKDGIKVNLASGNVNGTISVSAQISAVQQFISEHVNLILITPSDPQAIVPAVKLASAANIPVIAVNTSVGSGASTVTYAGADNYKYGQAEGRLVASAVGNKGNVALLEGVLGDSPEVLRTEGIKAVLKTHPKIHIVTTMVDNWTNPQNITDVQDLLSKYGDHGLSAVVAEGPEMYAGAEYARSHGDKTTDFVAGDYSKEVETAIKSGALYGTVDQDPGTQGKLGVEFAYDWLTGKKSKVPRPIYDTPLPLITKANVNKVQASWSS